MSNILIIKHGSLGDIVQASGAIQDIISNHKDDNIYLLTSKPYINLFKKNDSIKEIILDNRSSKFNLIYLYLLMRNIKKKILQKFMIYKILQGQPFTKEFYFRMPIMIFGRVH